MKQRFRSICMSRELTNAGIDALSGAIREGLAQVCKRSADLTRLCLSAEEAMLAWQARFGENRSCRLTIARRFRGVQIRLEAAGERLDPTEDDNLSEYSQTLLTRLGLKPAYSFRKGVNTLVYRWKPAQINPLVPIAAAVVLAVLCGFLGRWLTPQTREFLSLEVLQRLQDTFFGMLSMVAMPLIFCSLITGICGIGDTATLSGMGMRLIGRYYFTSLGATALGGIAMGALLGLQVETGAGLAGNVTAFLDMIFSMIPNNVVGAFYDGSFTQIMLLAIAMGIAMLILGQQTAQVLQVVEQLQQIFDKLMCWVCRMLPVGIFAILLSNIWANSLDEILQIWKPVALSTLILTAFLAGHLFLAGLRVKVSPLRLWKKLTPAFLVAFTSASSTAAYGEVVRCCTEDLGIRRKMVDFGVPVGLGVSSPGSSMAFMTAVVYAMCLTGVAASPVNFLMAFVLCTLLMMSAPSTAGGPVSCFAIMFAHLAVPEQALGTTIIVYLILDFYCTGINVATKALTLLEQAWMEEAVDTTLLNR